MDNRERMRELREMRGSGTILTSSEREKFSELVAESDWRAVAKKIFSVSSDNLDIFAFLRIAELTRAANLPGCGLTERVKKFVLDYQKNMECVMGYDSEGNPKLTIVIPDPLHPTSRTHGS